MPSPADQAAAEQADMDTESSADDARRGAAKARKDAILAQFAKQQQAFMADNFGSSDESESDDDGSDSMDGADGAESDAVDAECALCQQVPFHCPFAAFSSTIHCPPSTAHCV